MPTLLRAALRRRELRVMYQPIVDMRSGAWVGAEALVRWLRPDGEWVPPDVFIPMAEATGLVTQVTDAVMERALSELDAFLRREPAFFVSVNIAGADLRDATFPLRLADLTRRHGIRAANLHLEATERELLDDTVQHETLERLRAAGYSVAADDFGVGYSNLSHLDIAAFDYLKIDRFFVSRLGTGKAAHEVIPSIVALAAPRAITLIAEGVETAAQVACLLERGVALGQGYHFGRPMPAAAFVEAHGRSIPAAAA
jgi:sensor c-di-GMP phosphodiesterase-like protein